MIDDKPRAFVKLRVQGLTLGVDVAHMAEVSNLTSLAPMISTEPNVLGCINLRGILIPVLDAAQLCGLVRQESPPPFAAILTFKDKTLAIGVDEIAGLSKAQQGQLQSFSHATLENENVQTHAFLDKDQKVIILDVPAIFARPMIPTTNFHRFTLQNVTKSDRTTGRHLIFSAGGAVFSLAASEIHGTVPRTVIDQNALTSGFCLGSINYRLRRVAVANTVKLIGIGKAHNTAPSEVVILNISNEQLLGLAVDSITNLRTFDSASFAPMPQAMSEHFEFIDRIMVTPTGQLIYNIDMSCIRSDNHIRALSEVSANKNQVNDKVIHGSTKIAATAPDNRKFLTYVSGGEMATPIEQITGILDGPKDIMPLVSHVSALIGVFSHAGRPIPLVKLHKSLGTAQQEHADFKILLVGKGESQIGFAVDRINSLANSLRNFTTRFGEKEEQTVQLIVSGSPKMFHVVDLVGIAATLIKSDFHNKSADLIPANWTV